MERTKLMLKEETGQTTMEWMVLSIVIAIGLVVIGITVQNGVVQIIEALVGKIISIINSFSI